MDLCFVLYCESFHIFLLQSQLWVVATSCQFGVMELSECRTSEIQSVKKCQLNKPWQSSLVRLQTKCAGWQSFNDWNEQEKMSGFAILADWVLSIALKHCHTQKHIVISVCYVMAQYLSWKSPLWQHRTFTQVQNFFCLKSLIYAWNAQALLCTCTGLYLHRFIWPRRAKTLFLTSSH